ncbi:Uncharacterized protein EbC_pEb17200810 (plasmid) [Erwinia billingiae Eb661]|uniref:Uncharacterized protein n=1 Tax=Erwinia billingiae (strain Eb661) TaxID=634500 RepID=D8MJT6_ERWBE|nr:Uncharacterized protein EbC_pEb17200810 [Erwinia billingiae Eb661]
MSERWLSEVVNYLARSIFFWQYLRSLTQAELMRGGTVYRRTLTGRNSF